MLTREEDSMAQRLMDQDMAELPVTAEEEWEEWSRGAKKFSLRSLFE